VVISASPNTVGHSPHARLVATMIEVRSQRRLIGWREAEAVTAQWTVTLPGALPAGPGEGQVAGFVQDHEAQA
jgi:hypothetical protein